MGTHRDWFQPIYFVIADQYNEDAIYDKAGYVSYGMTSWPNRSVWIIPGTLTYDNC